MTIRFEDDDSDLFEFNSDDFYSYESQLIIYSDEPIQKNATSLEPIERDIEDRVKYSIQVVDNYDRLPLQDITTGYDDNVIYYNSPLSNYHQDYRQEQLTNSQYTRESALVMGVIGDRMNKRYFSATPEAHKDYTASSWFSKSELLKSLNSVAKVFNWFKRLN